MGAVKELFWDADDIRNNNCLMMYVLEDLELLHRLLAIAAAPDQPAAQAWEARQKKDFSDSPGGFEAPGPYESLLEALAQMIRELQPITDWRNHQSDQAVQSRLLPEMVHTLPEHVERFSQAAVQVAAELPDHLKSTEFQQACRRLMTRWRAKDRTYLDRLSDHDEKMLLTLQEGNFNVDQHMDFYRQAYRHMAQAAEKHLTPVVQGYGR